MCVCAGSSVPVVWCRLDFIHASYVLLRSAGPEVTPCEVSEAADKVMHLPRTWLDGMPS
jgi:hypothetical protein